MTLPDIPERYVLSAARADSTELLADWQPPIPKQGSLWLLTKFGEVFFCLLDLRPKPDWQALLRRAEALFLKVEQKAGA